MRMKRVILGFVTLVVLLTVFAVPTQPALAQSGHQVWTFYMGYWTGNISWDAQASVLGDWPSMGKYDSRDPGVAAAHIEQAQSAGIDAFLVSWYGTGETLTTTPTLNNMLDRAAERGFHVAAVLDCFNPNFLRDRGQIVSSLNYLIHDRANHPGYLRYNGKPVIVFAFQDTLGFSTADWLAIRNEVDPGRNTIWLAEGLNGCCMYGGAMDGMYAFNIAWAGGSAARYSLEQNSVYAQGGSLYVPTVHPGWDEDRIAARDGRANPTARKDRAGGQFLINSWNGATSVNPDVILIVSWNEFMEGSYIEPSQVYGTQSLDVLRSLIATWKAGAPASAPPVVVSPPATGTAGIVAEATSYNLNVRSGPGTEYTAVGQISPGTQYAVTGGQGDWLSINYNGQTGWVAGWLVRQSSGALSSSVPSAVPAAAAAGEFAEAISYSLNVRSGPGTEHQPVGQISPGTKYAVLGRSGDWVSIDYNGQTGWVAGWLVTITGVPVSAAPQPVIDFRASPTTVKRGQCATVAWDVENIDRVYFNGEGVVGHSSREVCPSSTSAYSLDVVLRDGSTTRREVTITVQ